MTGKKISALKKEVFYANKRLVEEKLVIFTFGNVSGIDRELQIIAIKPSGVDYNSLSWQDMVLVDIDGKVINSSLRPSSDTKTHLKLYREFSHIGGVAHTHSRYATAFAQAALPIACFGTTHADYFYGDVPCSSFISDESISKDYEEETGTLIVETFEKAGLDHMQVKACLVAGHGPFTWGDDAYDAVYMSKVLEEIARQNFLTKTINNETKPLKKTLQEKHYFRKHGKDAYYGQVSK